VDILLDATMFGPENEMDADTVAWLLQHLGGRFPLGNIYILNPTQAFQRYFKRISKQVSIARVVLLTDDELERYFSRKDIILTDATANAVEANQTAFTQITSLKHYRAPCPCIFNLGVKNLVIKSLKKRDFGGGLTCQTLDVIPLSTISDVRILTRLDSALGFSICADDTTHIFLDSRPQLGEVANVIRRLVKGTTAGHAGGISRSTRSEDSPATVIIAKTCLQMASDDVKCQKAAFDLGRTFATNIFKDHRHEREELVTDIAMAFASHTCSVLDLFIEAGWSSSPTNWAAITRPWLRNLALVHDPYQKARCRPILTRLFSKYQQLLPTESISSALIKLETLTPELLDALLAASNCVQFEADSPALGPLMGGVTAVSKLIRTLRNVRSCFGACFESDRLNRRWSKSRRAAWQTCINGRRSPRT
jgi:hypothetical protein